MSIDGDDELLQDFLVEAGEILDALGEQLVQLEQAPDDRDLLNAVFRGFHTIKGGAGFLNLEALVALCHRAEDVFNILRQKQRAVDADLMDAVLKVLDWLNAMFDSIRAGEEPEHADPALLQTLELLAKPGGAPAPAATPAPPPAASAIQVPQPPPAQAKPAPTPHADKGGDITDDEFEALLDALDEGRPAAAAPAAPAAVNGSDDITEEEFEALLDELHGKGPPGGAEPASAVVASTPAAGGDENITEEEFEDLLDQLYGKGKPPTPLDEESTPSPSAPQPATAPASSEPASTPTPVSAAKPAAPAPKAEVPKVAETKAAVEAETSVRVDTKRLDDMMNLVGELVLVRNRLATLRSSIADEQVIKAIANLDLVTSDLQTGVMKTRMQPVKKVFGRFPRVVRDLARSLKKEVNLELRGEETELDKNLVEALADPLVHLVRNAVDHGVERPDEREKAGKPRAGHVVLSAEQEGDHILLVISDDGKGMDPDLLRRKAVEKNLMDDDAASRLSDTDAFNLIFMAGFSTKAEISDVSGRGVGMDVVKTRIAQLNGTVEIDSKPGQGTTMRVKLPLTLAILPTLMVMLGEQRFALPLSSIGEILDLDLSRTNMVDDREVVMVRNQALPVYYLSRWLRKGAPSRKEGHVVVVYVGNQRVGLVVDNLLGQEEVVIKPLGALLHGQPGFAGATITGDGGIALIIDIPSLLKAYARRY